METVTRDLIYYAFSTNSPSDVKLYLGLSKLNTLQYLLIYLFNLAFIENLFMT